MNKFIVLIIFFLSILSNAIGQQSLFINELMAKNDSFIKDDDGEYSDWIEIYNSSALQINLEGYYLSDDKDTLNKWRIPDGNIIGGYGYYIFWCSGDNNKGKRHTNFKLSADGETLYLVAKDGKTIIDSVEFGPQEPNISYGRVEDGKNQWIYFENPTFASKNIKKTSDKLPVLINELMASNSKTIQDETGAYPDWIELYNNSNEEIDISGFYLTDEPFRNPTKWRIPSGTRIIPRGFLLIWADEDIEDGPFHCNFKLSKDGDTVAIFSKDGKTLIDLIAFGLQSTDISFGRKFDGSSEWIKITKPTPGASNGLSPVEGYNIPVLIALDLMPNPASGIINIHLSSNLSGNLLFRIFDYLGKVILIENKGFIEQGKYNFAIDISQIPTGFYYFQLLVNDYAVSKEMIIR